MTTIALFNDTEILNHAGCLGVSWAHAQMLAREGVVVRYRYYVDQHETFSVAGREASRTAVLCSPLRRVLSRVDAVVVNGEGTIHHGYGLHLLAILDAAQTLGCPTILVNAVLQDCPREYHEVLGRLDDLTVRDAHSAAYMQSLGIAHRLVLDSILEAPFADEATMDFSGRVILTDWHPTRDSDVGATLRQLGHDLGERAVRFPLDSPSRCSDWRHLVANWRSAELVVTARHHGVYLAGLAGVPFVAMPSNTWKMEGLLAAFGWPLRAWRSGEDLRALCEEALRQRAVFQRFREFLLATRPLTTFRSLSRLRPRRREAVEPRSLEPPPNSTSDAQEIEEAVVTSEQVLKFLGAGRVLDVACAAGRRVQALVTRGIDAQGCDWHPMLVAQAKERMHGRIHDSRLTQLPFEDESGDVTLCVDALEHVTYQDLPAVLAELGRVTRRALFVKLTTTREREIKSWTRGRAWWEKQFFAAAFRKHPSYLRVTPYEALELPTDDITMVLEKVPADAARRYPPTVGCPPNDGLIDPLREPGRAADAAVARYTLAADWVRRNDVVLDAGCGLGYGAHVLRSLTAARRIIGLDHDERAITYARDNFAVGVETLEYHTGDLQDLSFLSDHSLDVVVCFEAIEHVPEPERFFAAARRVLRPGGRLLVSVPNHCCDEHGRDPNPYHLHVYTWEKLHSQMQGHFLIEAAYQQIGGNGVVLSDRPRRLRSVPLDAAPTVEAEWWIMVGTTDPTQPPHVPYEEVFYDYSAPPAHLLAFARDYANPWLVRALVEYPTRAANRNVLLHIAERVLPEAADGSADQGAALCVQGYRVLESDSASAQGVETCLAGLNEYLTLPPQNAHQLRWRISLAFLRGQLHMKLGRFAEAERAFAACADLDCSNFSPTLGTKTVLAAFLAGWLNYVRADLTAARQRWGHGLAEARRLLRGDWTEFLGDPEDPLPFPLVTAVEFLDSAVLCANALRVTAAGVTMPPALLWAETHKCWKQMIEERWRGLQRAEDLIRERDETNAAQTRLIEERWQALQQMENMLRERDAWIVDLRRCLAAAERLAGERYAAIQDQTRLVAERDAWIADLRNRLATAATLAGERYAAIQDQTRLVAERDAWIADLRNRVATADKLAGERYAAIQDQTRLVAERDAWIADLRHRLATAEKLAGERYAAIQDQTRLVAERDAWIGDLRNRIAAAETLARERYEVIQTQSRMIAERDAEIAARRQQVAEAEAAVSRLESELRTRADRLAGELHAVTERLNGLETEIARYRGVLGRLLRVSRVFGVVLRPSRWRGKR